MPPITLEPPLVDMQTCIDLVFSEESRPKLRTFEKWKAKGWIPFKKIGHLVYFDVDEVRAAIDKQFSGPAQLYEQTKTYSN